MTNKQFFPAAKEQGVVGRFEHFDKLDVKKSKEADEEVYRQIVVLRTKVAGSHDVSVVPVKPHNQGELKRRFPDAWNAFQGEEVELDGTPIHKLKGITPEKAEAYMLQGIQTIEQMAEAGDNIVEILGFGARKLRERAQEQLKSPPADDGPVVVPDDWQSLHWKKKVALAEKMIGGDLTVEEDQSPSIVACEVIEAYLQLEAA